jgi:hypothetical protein
VLGYCFGNLLGTAYLTYAYGSGHFESFTDYAKQFAGMYMNLEVPKAWTKKMVAFKAKNSEHFLALEAQSMSRGNVARLGKKQRLRLQAGLEETIDASVNQIANNIRVFTFKYPRGDYSTYGVVTGRTVFLYKHFFAVHGRDFSEVVVSNGSTIVTRLGASKIKLEDEPGKVDSVVMTIDTSSIASAPSLEKRMLSYEDLTKMIEKEQVTIARVHRTTLKGVVTHRVHEGTSNRKGATTVTTTVTTDDERKERIMIDKFLVNVGSQGESGDCGLPYVAISKLDGKVYFVGFHVGRNGEDSYITPITLENCKKDMAYVAQCGTEVYNQGIYHPSWFGELSSKRQQSFDGKLISLGSFQRPGFIPSETNLIPSPFQGDEEFDPIYPISTAPALLKPTLCKGELIQPLVNGIAKLSGAPVRRTPDWIYDFVERHPERAHSGYFPTVRREFRMLTIEEAIMKLDTSSSVGIDGKRLGFRSRSEMWNKDTGWIHPLVRKEVAAMFQAMDEGYELKNVMEFCLKDETRDLERVRLGKTRVFCVGSVIHLIVTVMVLGDVVEFCKEHRGSTDVTVGTNPHGKEWEFISRKLKRFPNFAGGDFSNYDTSIGYVLAYFFFLGFYHYVQWICPRKNWYLRCVVTSTAAPYGIISGEVYYLNFMNCSGNWCTTQFNSYVNNLMSNCHFEEVTFETDLFGTCVSQNLARVLYGDDNVFSVSDKLKGKYTMRTFASFVFENFGMTYTTPNKGDIVSDYLTWDELSFLCRTFDQSSGVYHCPLDEASIHGMVLWIRKPAKGVSVQEQLSINVEQACMEYFHYGRAKFEQEKLRLWTYSKRFNIPWRALTYDQYAERFADAILRD